MRIFFYLAPLRLCMNINQLFYWDNAQQEFSKNQVFKNKISFDCRLQHAQHLAVVTLDLHFTCHPWDRHSRSKYNPKQVQASCGKVAPFAPGACCHHKKGLLSCSKCSLQVPREWPRCRRLPLFGLQQHGLLKLQPIDQGRES